VTPNSQTTSISTFCVAFYIFVVCEVEVLGCLLVPGTLTITLTLKLTLHHNPKLILIPVEVLSFGLTNSPSSLSGHGHMTSINLEISENISETVEDSDIVRMKD